MEYFVSTENTPYYHWQLELLIESFNHHKIESQLLVALAESDAPIRADFCRNLFNHKRLYGHQNIGEIRGFNALNSFYSLMWSLEFNNLKQPLAIISSDVVLQNPLQINFNDNIPEVVFSPDPFFTIEKAEEEVGPFWEWVDRSKADYETKWATLGAVLVFNKTPFVVFQRAMFLAEKLALQQLVAGRPIWKHTDRLAWVMNLADFVGQIQIRGEYWLTTTMLGGSNTPFIHYEHGLPPVFNKTMFQYSPPNFVSLGDPFQILAANSPTPASHFISQLAQSSLAARVE